MAAMQLELRKIVPNLRIVYSIDSINELCRSIRSLGQLEPIQVWFDGECFRIMDGERRWRACASLRMARLDAVIIGMGEANHSKELTP